MKAMAGDVFPKINHDSRVRSQWGHSNFPRCIFNMYLYMLMHVSYTYPPNIVWEYIYIYIILLVVVYYNISPAWHIEQNQQALGMYPFEVRPEDEIYNWFMISWHT